MKEKRLILPHMTLFSLPATKRLVHAIETQDDITLFKGAVLIYPNVVLNSVASPFKSIVDFLSKGLNKKYREELSKCIISGANLENYSSSIEGVRMVDIVLKTIGIDKRKIIDQFSIMEENLDKDPFFYEDPFIDQDPLISLYLTKCLKLPYFESMEKWKELSSFFQKFEFKVNSVDSIVAGIPNLAELSWDSILELRKSPFIEPFRAYMFTVSPEPTELLENIEKELWNVLGQVTPSKKGSAFQRIIASMPVPVPVPLPNPYGVYREAKEAKKEKDMFNKYGWLFFLQQARSMQDRQKTTFKESTKK